MIPVTYCTNIHPGESWTEARANIESHGLAVKAACLPDAPFPLGLRVSGRAASEIDAAEARRFRDWLTENGLYVATVNGFPYGAFHLQPVKAAVYRPDWRSRKRLNYTLRLADLLAVWLPHGLKGSISTVPLGFAREFGSGEDAEAMRLMKEALEGLARLFEETGKRIRLSVEPEPGCLLETSDDLSYFFGRMNLPERLRPHLAACYDCCHQALQFEDPEDSLKLLFENGVPIGHVQVSSALRLESGAPEKLSRFIEPVYLHQAVAKTPEGLCRFDDLPEALAGGVRNATQWRAHFHLPVFMDSLPECATTNDFLRRILPLFPKETPMEVETYTFSVLPADLQTPTVTESIIREIKWVEEARRGR